MIRFKLVRSKYLQMEHLGEERPFCPNPTVIVLTILAKRCTVKISYINYQKGTKIRFSCGSAYDWGPSFEKCIGCIRSFSSSCLYRDRLIHTQVVNDELITRLMNQNRIVDIQPRFVVSDFPWVQERLGEKRIHTPITGNH